MTLLTEVHGGKMGWWMLLLLHLHLAAGVSLPAPADVSISSFNMEHTLSFQPGPETPPGSHFRVETIRKRSWVPVAGCSGLTAGQTCNLTRAFKEPLDQYQVRVRAFTSNLTSRWTVSGWFQPLMDTVLGPPDVSVSGCGNCLLLRLSVPTERGLQLLTNFHRELVLDVRRTRDGAQFKLNLRYKEEIVISYLQPGVEYCVNVSVKTLFNPNTVSSRPHCAFTSPPLPASSLNVVYGLVASFCFLGFLLMGLVACGSQLSIGFLKQRLRRALTYLLLKESGTCAARTLGSDLSHVAA